MPIAITILLVAVNCVVLWWCLYNAFGKKFRPITWVQFNSWIGAALVNLVAILINGFLSIRWLMTT